MVVYAIPLTGDWFMRRINKVFLTACGYAILILSLFYAFAAISDFTSDAIAPQQFALILGFGFIISIAEFTYEELKLKKIYKCIIHYFVLLVAFCLIFIVSGNVSSQKPSAIFIAIVLYTVSYFTIYGIVRLVRMSINFADDKLDQRNATDKKSKKDNNKGTYKSLYGGD